MSSKFSELFELPQTPAQWEKYVTRETIQAPRDSIKRKMTTEEISNLHVGEHPINLSIRDLSGWQSASEVKLAHFLTTRILWKFVPLDSLKRGGLLGISKDVKEYVSKYLRDDAPDFVAYLEDMDTNPARQPPPGQATPLGIFTWVRSLQWQIIQNANMGDEPPAGPSLGRRSLGGPVHLGLDGTMDSEGDTTMDDSDGSETTNDDYTDDNISEVTTDEYTEPGSVADETVSLFSDESFVPDAVIQTDGEDVVNVSLLALLSALTLRCERARLDWDVKKKRLDSNLGHAKIRSVNDGCLRDRETGDVLAVVETKPFRLFRSPEQTLMQMGLELLAHILDCVQNERQKNRYYLFSQHYNGTYVTWATFDPGYIDYLTGKNGAGAATRDFLDLRCVGPFAIDKSSHALTFALLVVGLVVQDSEDRLRRKV
ncbi:hypothetical protein BO78DRAFT_382401 [Aspergillus sclerotiicarbonarius CBS 121057]|uniref:Uncharacterized protein n=1 Tax=Aspergillus sclerotiicarbonarius (strain CBS 121057 / IBT 28362) TaxID=1448318 RepID=A0A319F1V4_ASPSB|nr:hypothetical protein BO78DRAFT_382401 [Aspergillus sclerotiicarbonarius CBS 121057]